MYENVISMSLKSSNIKSWMACAYTFTRRVDAHVSSHRSVIVPVSFQIFFVSLIVGLRYRNDLSIFNCLDSDLIYKEVKAELKSHEKLKEEEDDCDFQKVLPLKTFSVISALSGHLAKWIEWQTRSGVMPGSNPRWPFMCWVVLRCMIKQVAHWIVD